GARLQGRVGAGGDGRLAAPAVARPDLPQVRRLLESKCVGGSPAVLASWHCEAVSRRLAFPRPCDLSQLLVARSAGARGPGAGGEEPLAAARRAWVRLVPQPCPVPGSRYGSGHGRPGDLRRLDSGLLLLPERSQYEQSSDGCAQVHGRGV